MKQNIPKFYAYAVFGSLSFAFVPIYVLFMNSRGLSFTEIGIATAFYYFMFFVFEIPTGVIADKLGRKKTLLLGMLGKSVALIVSIFAYSFWAFLVAELCFSLSRSFSSGADSAFVYDSLAMSKQSEKYLHTEGRLQSVRLASHVIGGLIGAGIAFYSLEGVYLFSALMAVIGFFLVLLLKEPKLYDENSKSMADYWDHMIVSIREVFSNKKMIWLILYSSLIFILLRAALIGFAQPLLIFLELPEFSFGIVDAVLSLGGALISWYAYRIEKRLGVKKILLVLPLVVILSFVGIGLTMSLVSIIFYLLTLFAWGLRSPVFRQYLNAEIKSNERRATILSVESLISRVGFSIVMVLIGFGLDHLGLQTSLFALSAFALVAMFVLLGFRRRMFS